MIRWFRVLDRVSIDSKKLRAKARSMACRTWELKSRGVDLDLDRMRRELPTSPVSERHLTILFARDGKKHFAIFAEAIFDET
jgi:hypothetical protein